MRHSFDDMKFNPFSSPGSISSPHSLLVRGQIYDAGEAIDEPARNDTVVAIQRVQNGIHTRTSSPSTNHRQLCSNNPANSSILVKSARKEWKKHGTALSQNLEERRREHEEKRGTLTARILGSVTRYDVTNNRYTSYVIRVKHPNNDVLQTEKRYSEFASLNDSFKCQGIFLDATFPPKNLAGRIGNWTPSLSWAPSKFEELVRYRKIQLDAWLVAVAAKYNIGDLNYSLASKVWEFLTHGNTPPCDQENSFSLPYSEADVRHHNSTGLGNSYTMRWNNPICFTMGSSIRQACRIVENLTSESDKNVPLDLLHCAKGLICLTVVKAGLVVSARIGTGCCVTRVGSTQRWSAPIAMGTVGIGYGLVLGADVTQFLLVLTTEDAVKSMLHGTVQLGIDVGVAVGPVGRSSNVSASASKKRWALHPAYSYAHSKGLYTGVSVEGAVLSVRNDVNSKFYARHGLSPDTILDFPQPKAAAPLYDVLEKAVSRDIGNGFRPSRLFIDDSDVSDTTPALSRFRSS